MNSPTVATSLKPLPSVHKVRLHGSLVVQRGRATMFTAISAHDLVRQGRVDTYNPVTEKGYQRDGLPSRMRAASQYYEAGGTMPNPLLVNIREEDFSSVGVVITSGDPDEYNTATEDAGDWIGAGFVEFADDLSIWIYDGQHREGGIRDLVKREAEFGTFPVPLSITLGLNELAEMREFYEVNTNAKSVKTDLAWELLRHMAKSDPELAEELELSGKDWTTRGIDVAKALDKMDGPWAGRIQFPNQKRTGKDSLVIAMAQFVQSIKPVLDMALFQKADAETIAQVLNAYWKGIATVLPEPFDANTSPKDWAIQKGTGSIPLHRAFPRVVEVVRARSRRLGDPVAYAEVMKPLQSLQGEITHEATGDAKVVSGADFWRAGGEGVAGVYSGEAGRKRLFLMIQALLPRPSSEIEL